MLGMRHPFSDALYERDGQGNLLVTDGDGWGRFRVDGTWIEGPLRECDPQLCGWVAGPIIPNHRVVETVPAPPGAHS